MLDRRSRGVARLQLCSTDIPLDTSCILAWLIEQGYEVYAFMADVGQEEVRSISLPIVFGP
jgi:hypothetical protein